MNCFRRQIYITLIYLIYVPWFTHICTSIAYYHLCTWHFTTAICAPRNRILLSFVCIADIHRVYIHSQYVIKVTVVRSLRAHIYGTLFFAHMTNVISPGTKLYHVSWLGTILGGYVHVQRCVEDGFVDNFSPTILGHNLKYLPCQNPWLDVPIYIYIFLEKMNKKITMINHSRTPSASNLFVFDREPISWWRTVASRVHSGGPSYLGWVADS